MGFTFFRIRVVAPRAGEYKVTLKREVPNKKCNEWLLMQKCCCTSDHLHTEKGRHPHAQIRTTCGRCRATLEFFCRWIRLQDLFCDAGLLLQSRAAHTIRRPRRPPGLG